MGKWRVAMASVDWSAAALRDLDFLDRSIAQRVIQKVKWFGENLESVIREPLHHNLKQVYKLRVGSYRVFYILRNGVVRIEAVKHRSEAYQ